MNHKDKVSKMTLWEKALFMSGRDIWSTWDLERLGIKSIVLSDGPHGIRKQLGDSDHLGLNESMKSTCFPTSATVANSWDLELAEEIGQCLGDEANQLGVNVVLGPGLNIKRNPLCGRNFEYFSEDPYLTGKLASSYVKGIQSRGVSACPKHFAVNSQELRRMANDSIVDERTLREIYLRGFEIIVDEAKPMFLMTSYNKVNGTYANENSYLLKDILVDEWGFKGAVVSDWGGSFNHVEGVKAGSHLEMPGTRVMGAQEIVEAVKNGELSEDTLDQRVDEILAVILKLSENKNIVGENLTEKIIDKHHEIAKRASKESIVLLENKGKILPINKNQKISVVGDFAKSPRYQGAGSSVVNTTKLDSIMNEINSYGFHDVNFTLGYERNGKVNETLVNTTIDDCKNSDVILVFAGLTEVFESEGVDRKHMNLPENQNHLITELASKYDNVVVILSGGSPVELPWADDVKGILHTYLAGQAGACGILDVITGLYNPSGKLNETYVHEYEDVPSSSYYPGLEKTSEYREGIFVGYRFFESANKEVKYPFGYGLSYTNFEYSNFSYDKKSNIAKVTIKNTGDYDGKEIPQIYVSIENSNIFRSKKELVGFTKVFLEKGSEKEVTIKLDNRVFEYFNVKTNKWEVEKGEYKLLIGKSSKDICLELNINVEGTSEVIPYNKENLKSYYDVNIKNVPDADFRELLGRNIPETNWDKNKPLTYHDTISQLYYAKSFVGRFAHKILKSIIEKNEKKGKPDLNMLFVYNQTFTAIYKMTNGMINKKMIGYILMMVNGRFFKGISKLIPEYFANKKLEKQVLEDLRKNK